MRSISCLPTLIGQVRACAVIGARIGPNWKQRGLRPVTVTDLRSRWSRNWLVPFLSRDFPFSGITHGMCGILQSLEGMLRVLHFHTAEQAQQPEKECLRTQG
jgi:hypothetical protein